MFGINGSEAIILLAVAVLVIGPERVPRYVRKFSCFITDFRLSVSRAKRKLEEEIGGEVAWEKLNLRQYDPRIIIRDALQGDLSDSEFRSEFKNVYGSGRGMAQGESSPAPRADVNSRLSDVPLLPAAESGTVVAEKPVEVRRHIPFDSEAT